MLVVKKRMNTTKQLGKGDNACQRPFDITQLFETHNLRNVIKSVFDVNMHHDPIKV
jgi:hypothetical protein